MSELEPPAPGWWQASDNNWYPPELHPDSGAAPLLPVAPHPAPPLEPTPAVQPATPLPSEVALSSASAGSDPNSRRKIWWVVGAAALVALAAVGALVARTTDTSDRADEATNTATEFDPETLREELPGGEDTDRGDIETGDPAQDGESRFGSREDPFAYDAPVPVVFPSAGDAGESVWNVRVSTPTDITDRVLDESSINDAPPEDVRFVGFDVEMTLVSARQEPLAPGFNFTWEILGGASSAVYEASTLGDVFGCGLLFGDFDRSSEVFLAGAVTGTVCIPLPAEDLDADGTQVAMNFVGNRFVFAVDGARPGPAPLTELSTGPQGTNFGYGASVPVTVPGVSDATRSALNVAVNEPRDVGSIVLGENSFNDPPPDGLTYLGFDVEMTLAAAEVEPLAPGRSFSWEVLGGATAAIYESRTLGLPGCGAIPGELNDNAEIFTGGTLTGLVCIPVPTEDVGHPDTQVAMNFSGDRFIFSDDGPTPVPADLELGAGPAAVGVPLPFDVAAEVQWGTFGDATNSTWTVTVSTWRDITDEVAAENSFNDLPPDGFIFVGIDVEMALVESEQEPQSPISNSSWEILGAGTRRVYRLGTLPDTFGCGVVPDGFDSSNEVFTGGTLSGTVCIPVPASDFADPDTRIALNLSGTRLSFAPPN